MHSHGQRHRLRLWLAIIIFVLALVVLAVSFSPGTRIEQTLPMPPVVLPSATPISLLFSWKGI